MGKFVPEAEGGLKAFVDEAGNSYSELYTKYEGKKFQHFKGSIYTCVDIAFDSVNDRWNLVLVKDYGSPNFVACFRTPENFEETHESGPKRFTEVV